MTLVVTGRSVLGVLNVETGTSTVEALQSKLGADQVALLRVIRSLKAARLISVDEVNGSPHSLSLTEAGRKWCDTEFRSGAKSEVPAAEQRSAAPASAVRTGTPRLSEPPARSIDLRVKPTARHTDRMRGVDVVRVSRRQRPTSPPPKLESPPPPRESPPLLRESPPPAEAPAPRPVVPEIAPTPAAAEKTQRGSQHPASKHADEAVRYTVDQDGFVTHINGRKIF